MAQPYPSPEYDGGFRRPDETLPLPATPELPGPAGPRPPYVNPPPVPPPMLPMPTEQVLAQIGEISVTANTVRTPVGEFPLAGSRWLLTDQWMTTQKTPQWAMVVAIVCTIVFLFCLPLLNFLFLLFLLAKETVYSGTVNISVSNGPYQYDTRVPVMNQGQVQHLHNMVNYVRSLATV